MEETIVVNGEPRMLAESICTLHKDPVPRRAMGERGRITVRGYLSWESPAEEMESLYMKIRLGAKRSDAGPHEGEYQALRAGSAAEMAPLNSAARSQTLSAPIRRMSQPSGTIRRSCTNA
jgi:hypothetical protein